MNYEEHAKRAAEEEGWYINQDGLFATNMGTDVEDVITNILPTDPGAWSMLCNMEGIGVSAPTPLEQDLAQELTRMQILGPDQDALAAAKAIMQWMVEEYDRQIIRALSPLTG